LLPSIKPMRLQRVAKPFDNPDYIFELKHDGFRAIAYVDDGKCKLVSRNQNHFNFLFLSVALGKFLVDNAILDGEVVCLDANGVSQFNHLISRKREPVFYAFDLLWLNGKDLRRLPLLDRKQQLEKLIKKTRCREILYAHHIVGNGVGFFEEICTRDLEGIIAKRKRGVYRDDGKDWLKIKNPRYSRAEGRHDVMTHKKR
jgi:bifunctional non-homologous end joining protein LigD